MSTKLCCMLMRVAIDCKGCYKKLRRTILNMKEVETHMIEREYDRVSVCGRFRPSDVAIKIRRRMKRRVEILEIQDFDGDAIAGQQQDQPIGPDSGNGPSHGPSHGPGPVPGPVPGPDYQQPLLQPPIPNGYIVHN